MVEGRCGKNMAITLRRIEESDLEMIMNWRMDPDITRYMNTNPKLTMEVQKKWLRHIEADDTTQAWIIEQDGMPAGLIQLTDIDWENKSSSWGYYVGEKQMRSLHLAVSLEMSLYDYVFDVLGFKELQGEVFSLNDAVIRLHLACGSHITEERKREVEKDGVYYDVTHLCITSNEWNRIREGKKYEKIRFLL